MLAMSKLWIFTGCKYPGCSRPRYCEPYGFVHEFCGRTHATAYSQLTSPSQLGEHLFCLARYCVILLPFILASSNLKLKRAETSLHGSTKQGHTKPVIANHKFGNTNHLSKTNSTVSAYSSVAKPDIKFYHRNEPYYEFTNFAWYPIKLDGKRWPTTEHYFQAQKFIGTPYVEAIRKQHSARGAFDMSRNPAVFRWLRSDWEIVKKDIMLKCLRAKFSQHEILAQKLLATSDRKLVEHTSNDSYWGDGGDGSGLNMLGRLLMQVRKEMSTSKSFQLKEKSQNTVMPLSEHKGAITSSVKHKTSGHRRSHSFSGTIGSPSANLTNRTVSDRHGSPFTTPALVPSSSNRHISSLPSSKKFGSTGNLQCDRHNSLHSHVAPDSSVHSTSCIPTSKRYGSTGSIHRSISNKSSSSQHLFGKTTGPKNKNVLKSYPPNDATHGGSHNFRWSSSHEALNIITWKPL